MTIFAAILEVFIEGWVVKTPFIINNLWLYLFTISFVVAALVEESLKFRVVQKHTFNKKEFNEVMDGISYTIIASLGFAVMENIFYVLEGGFTVGVLRSFTAVPAHALFSGVMGYYIGKSVFSKNPKTSRKLKVKGLFYGIFYHGTYNFLLLAQNFLTILVVPLMVIMALHLKHNIYLAQLADGLKPVKPSLLTFGRMLRIVIGTILLIIGFLIILGLLVNYDNANSISSLRGIPVTLITVGTLYIAGMSLIFRGI